MLYHHWKRVAIAVAVVLACIDAYAVGGTLYAREGGVTYLVAGGTAVALCAPLLPLMAELCWSEGRYVKSVTLWVISIPVIAIVILSAAERASDARDREDRLRVSQVQRVTELRSAIDDTADLIRSLKQSAKEECSPKAGGRGDNCRKLEGELLAAHQELNDLRSKIVEAGAPQAEDPLARRLARLASAWVTQEQVALYYPLLLPVTLPILGIVLLAAGSSRNTQASTPPAPPRRRKGNVVKAGKKRRTMKGPTRRGPLGRKPGQVIMFPRPDDRPPAT